MPTPRKPNLNKAERARTRFFADTPKFEPRAGQFSPLPWIYRRLQWMFRPRDWQLLTYLIMRSGPEAIVWLTDKQIAHDLDLGHRKVGPHLRSLATLGFIAIAEGEGSRFIAITDPVRAIVGLVGSGQIHGERLEALREDLDLLNISLEPDDDTLIEVVTPTADAISVAGVAK